MGQRDGTGRDRLGWGQSRAPWFLFHPKQGWVMATSGKHLAIGSSD